MALVLHKVSITSGSASKVWYFKAPDGTYTGAISTATGVDKAADTEQDEAPHRVSDLLAKGILTRITVSYGTGTSRKQAKLLCQRTKVGTVLDDLEGKALKSSTISSARIPRSMSFY